MQISKRVRLAGALGITTVVVTATAAYAATDTTVVIGANAAGTPALTYTPSDITVFKGDTVTWTNHGDRAHSATSGTGPQDPDSGANFDSGLLPQTTGTFTKQFDEVGTFPFYCKVQPRVGFFPHFNAGMKGNVHVLYKFGGFQAPIDPEPTVNTAKAGSAIPIKFSLSGYQGTDILGSVDRNNPDSATYPVSQQSDCASGAPTDAIEETADPGDSGLSYDAMTDTYTFVWKTQKAWSGQCRTLQLRFADGATTPYTASFRFTK